MATESKEKFFSQEEVHSIIREVAMELLMTGLSVNNATLSSKLVTMADNETDDERVLLYWLARRLLI